MSLPKFPQHPDRHALAMELHTRPFERIPPPAKVSHLAYLHGEGGVADERARVIDLCRRFSQPEPGETTTHFAADLGPFRLKWERHTEFSSLTFIRCAPFSSPFDETVLDLVPRDWLEALPGEVLVATHLALEPAEAPERTMESLSRVFSGNATVGLPCGGRRGAGVVGPAPARRRLQPHPGPRTAASTSARPGVWCSACWRSTPIAC